MPFFGGGVGLGGFTFVAGGLLPLPFPEGLGVVEGRFGTFGDFPLAMTKSFALLKAFGHSKSNVAKETKKLKK